MNHSVLHQYPSKVLLPLHDPIPLPHTVTDPARSSRDLLPYHLVHSAGASGCRAITLFFAFLALLLMTAGCTAPVRVEWSTETEMNTAGFNLYRSESPDGPFDVKVNDQLIPASSDPLTGGQYSFIDRTARSGVTYYYQLQEVEKTGGVNTYGPIDVRAGGLRWWYGGVLGVLVVIVLALWVRKRSSSYARGHHSG